MAFDMDILTQVSTAQVLGTGATLSTYSIPLGAAVKNDEIDFVANVSSVSGTTPTLAIEVIGADDAGLTSNVVSLGRVDPVIATGMAPKNFYVDGELLDKKAFVGLRYTMGGTTPACTVTASAVIGKQRGY